MVAMSALHCLCGFIYYKVCVWECNEAKSFNFGVTHDYVGEYEATRSCAGRCSPKGLPTSPDQTFQATTESASP